MDPTLSKSTNEMSLASSSYRLGHSNPNVLMSSTHPLSSMTSPNKTRHSNHRYSYSDLPSGSTSALNYMDLFRTWNYHQYLISTVKTDSLSDNSSSDQQPRNSSFHQYYPRSFDKLSSQSSNEEHILGKFHHDTLVQLDTGESKNIQLLTTHDLLTSAQHSPRYSRQQSIEKQIFSYRDDFSSFSLLARIDHIGTIDHATGKVELRFYIEEINKTVMGKKSFSPSSTYFSLQTSYYVLQEMPFFVHQYSSWSSVSPEHTHRLCGLKCRQLECGDHIIAVTERLKSSSSSSKTLPAGKPDYSQQSPTKSLVGRYINGQISSSNKRPRLSNE